MSKEMKFDVINFQKLIETHLYPSLKELSEIINDPCISYKRFKSTHIYISQLVKHCQHPYAMIVKDDELIGVIDIDNKVLIRFTSNKNFVDIAKIGKLSVTKIIRG